MCDVFCNDIPQVTNEPQFVKKMPMLFNVFNLFQIFCPFGPLEHYKTVVSHIYLKKTHQPTQACHDRA